MGSNSVIGTLYLAYYDEGITVYKNNITIFYKRIVGNSNEDKNSLLTSELQSAKEHNVKLKDYKDYQKIN